MQSDAWFPTFKKHLNKLAHSGVRLYFFLFSLNSLCNFGSLILPDVSVACVPHMLLSRVVNRGPSGSSALQSSQISSLIRTFSLAKQNREQEKYNRISVSVSPSPRRYDLRRLH